ncbi:FAD-dependent oxidoreductase [Chloroflexota bacterium]
MSRLKKIFEPGMIGNMSMNNRLVMSAMQTRAASDDHFVTDRLIEYYEVRARGGVGLIIVQQSFAWEEACLANGLGLWDDKFIPGLQKLANTVKRQGVKIAIQLGARGTMVDKGMKSVAPSALPSAWDGDTPREITIEEILSRIDEYAEAGRRAKTAGFDAIEIHGAHGHLISQFLSPYTNRRNDDYGGNLENRCRFACDIIKALRQSLGKGIPIIFRMNGSDFVHGGIDIADAKLQASLLVSAGADALHVSGATHETIWFHFPSYRFPSGFLVPLAAAIKKVVPVPVITVGKIGDPYLAESILRKNKADFVAMGRALLADPALPNKAREGKLADINKCIYCMNCLQSGQNVKLSCTVNPALLREREFELHPVPTPKKVLIIGGGLAGMETARILSQRRHQVTLCEEGSRLGGQWNVASKQRYKSGFASVTQRLIRDLARQGVEIILNKEATADWVKEGKWHTVVIATGATSKGLDVPGGDTKNVVQAVDVLKGNSKVGKKVVVIGGREQGMGVADFLAQSGREVSLVTRRELGRDTNRLITAAIRDSLAQHPVCIYPNSPVLEIRDRWVYIANNESMLRLEADTIVLATGSIPRDGLIKEIKGDIEEIHIIGDCKEPRDAMQAVNEGAELGLAI